MSPLRWLVVLGVAAALAAGGWLLRGDQDLWGTGPLARAQPVPAGDQEVAFLHFATSGTAWDRFVEAVRYVEGSPAGRDAGLQVDYRQAYSEQTAAAPAVGLRLGQSRSTLWVRWYKLTGEMGLPQWLRALAERQPPPVAVVGGNTSVVARELALALAEFGDRFAPALLITTATAEQLDIQGDLKDLMDLYPRSFRFCFTNGQMAAAVADFVAGHPELQPDKGPYYLVEWKDDYYTIDFNSRFKDVVAADPGRWDIGPPWTLKVNYSVGTFNQPNAEESDAAKRLIDKLRDSPQQKRPVLVLPATSQPARRFLRALVRHAPADAGKFTVVTGDSIDFNTVYRDRNLHWPIQDLPFSLVFTCHFNPVSEPAGFQAEAATAGEPGWRATGTEDKLLYADLVTALVRCAFSDGRATEDPARLAGRLLDSRLEEGGRRFDPKTRDRQSLVGEYVVYLRPERDGDRVQPQARLRVYRRQPEGGRWATVFDHELAYDQAPGVPGRPSP